MRSSSARQQQFDFAAPETSTGGQADVAEPVESTERKETDSATFDAKFPTFGVDNTLFAAAARRAGRLNAATATDKEIDDFLSERQRLLDKQFAKTITRPEELRLQYVRWNLDRIEDAKYGMSLDALEDWVVQYEKFRSDIENLQSDLSHHLKGKRK